MESLLKTTPPLANGDIACEAESSCAKGRCKTQRPFGFVL
jgi:hypothetical protein